MTTKKNIINSLYFISITVIALSIGVLVKQVHLYAQPMKYWIEYYSVQPVSSVFLLDGPLSFASDSIIRENSLVRYADILFCKADEGDLAGVWVNIGEANAGGQIKESRNRKVSIWDWSGILPRKDSTCFLEAHVILDRGWFGEYSQIIRSREFRVQKVK